jgi:hypothetical protein
MNDIKVPLLRILAITEGILRPDRSTYGVGAMLDVVDGLMSESFGRFKVERLQLNEDGERLKDVLKRAVREDTDYDQIWFFGGSESGNNGSRPLDDDEVELISRFMKAGGGVFATGDHETVGAPLCARIPRVRYMRSWGLSGGIGATPAATSALRADTLFMPPFSAQYGNEGDKYGKPVWPLYVTTTWPHPLLYSRSPDVAFSSAMPQAPEGPIAWFPDHMHEGVCYGFEDSDAVSKAVPEKYAEILKDFPGKARPSIVGWSLRRGFRDEEGVKQAEPFAHAIVGCYDGRKQNPALGRIVVDSTFHHWVSSNTEKMQKSRAWRLFSQYPLNIAKWLSRPYGDISKKRKALESVGESDSVKAVYKVSAQPADEYLDKLTAAAQAEWLKDETLTTLDFSLFLDDLNQGGELPQEDKTVVEMSEDPMAELKLQERRRTGLLFHKFLAENK